MPYAATKRDRPRQPAPRSRDVRRPPRAGQRQGDIGGCRGTGAGQKERGADRVECQRADREPAPDGHHAQHSESDEEHEANTRAVRPTSAPASTARMMPVANSAAMWAAAIRRGRSAVAPMWVRDSASAVCQANRQVRTDPPLPRFASEALTADGAAADAVIDPGLRRATYRAAAGHCEHDLADRAAQPMAWKAAQALGQRRDAGARIPGPATLVRSYWGVNGPSDRRGLRRAERERRPTAIALEVTSACSRVAPPPVRRSSSHPTPCATSSALGVEVRATRGQETAVLS